jgi:hypothetical protein
MSLSWFLFSFACWYLQLMFSYLDSLIVFRSVILQFDVEVISSKESFACCCCCYRMLLVLGLFRVDCGPVHQLLYLLLVLGNSSRGCFKCFHYLFRLTYSLCGLIELLSFMSLSFYFFCNFFLSYIKYYYEYIYGRGWGSLGRLMILGKYVFAPSNYINFHF